MTLLNETPEITFFRVLFHRHTPFSKEFVVEPAGGDESATNYSAVLSKAGDLVHRIVIRARLSPVTMIGPEPSDTSWIMDPRVLRIFQGFLPLSPDSTIFTIYSNVISTLGISNILKGTISETEAFMKVNRVEGLLGFFGNATVYRAYQFLSFVELMFQLQTEYANDKNASLKTMQEFSNHPLHDLVYLNGAATRRLPGKLPDLSSEMAPHIFDSFYVDVGGTNICRYDSHFYRATTCLREKFASSEYGALSTVTVSSVAQDGTVTLHIPFLFYFCDYNSIALPLCGLRYHETRIGVTTDIVPPFLGALWKVVGVDFLVEYIHLSDRERLKFATSNLEYLIHQVQEQVVTVPPGTTQLTQELTFTRPSIELLWFVVVYTDDKGVFDPSFPRDVLLSSQLTLGSDSLGTETMSEYYRLVAPSQAHTAVSNNGVHCYSFALDAEQYQPSGALNLGRIPHVYLQVGLNPSVVANAYKVELRVYSRCYNVLRIANGFSDVAFS